MYVGPTIAIQMPPAVTLMAVSLVHVILASRAMVGLAQVYNYLKKTKTLKIKQHVLAKLSKIRAPLIIPVKHGSLIILILLQFPACSSTTFGSQCSQACTCNVTNTVDCDDVTGACTCKSGWNGTNCDVDINECSNGMRVCNSTTEQCVNSDGSSECVCLYGSNGSECLCKYTSQHVRCLFLLIRLIA